MSSGRSKKRFGLASLAAGTAAATGPTPEIAISGLDAWAIRSSPEAVPRLVIALRTSAGVTGYGETSAGADPASSVAEALRHANALVGKDAMASMAVRVSLSAAAPAIRGAVDIALLDVRGKIADAPVYDLLAGRTRDKARAMASLRGSSEAELSQQLSAARNSGFRAFSVPALLPQGTPTRGREFFANTEAMLRRLRQAGATDLVLDCAGRTTAAEAAGLAARLETFHLMWMDEPTSPISDSALEKISHESVTPVGWGRFLTSSGRFQDLLRMQVIDVLRPDIGLHGISGVRQLASLAEAYYTAVAPFHRGGPIGAAAALQVAASIPNFVVQEVAFSTDAAERRMHTAIAGDSVPQVVNGFFELPTGPGLGLEIDEAALQEYAA
ncbi:MAG: hypothetical protein F4X77_18960 [Acidobacteriia bacterium]|nr:hypothetical protein [Terriglobia bacterium]MYC68757.1 hypothetical protein [Terriglobia bacterium]